MYSTGNDVLEFKLNYKTTRKVRKGFLSLRSENEDLVILNDGK